MRKYRSKNMCTVYLIHLDTPIRHAKHYLGYTASEDTGQRLKRHRSGCGARLLQVANELQITYNIVRTWKCNNHHEARKLERKLKHKHNSPKLCPVCNPNLTLIKNCNNVVYNVNQ